LQRLFRQGKIISFPFQLSTIVETRPGVMMK